jgi:hypothetical protein
LRIPGVTGPGHSDNPEQNYQGLVPVVMSDAEDAFSDELLPQVVISRGSIQPAMQRWQPGGREYKIAAAMATEVVSSGGVRGPSMLEMKDWTLPFDIQYDVHIRARLKSQANLMFRALGKVLWSYGQVRVRDSEGDERGYYAFCESIDNLSEISDISERMLGHTFSLRVEGELDFHEPFLARTTPVLKIRTGPLRAR